jgi:hypothetical protein
MSGRMNDSLFILLVEWETRDDCLFVCNAVDVDGLIIFIDDSHVTWEFSPVVESSCLHVEVMLADVVLTSFTLDDGSPIETTHLLVSVG